MSGLSCGIEACGILVLGSGIKPVSPALQGRVLATGPPGEDCPILEGGAISHWAHQRPRTKRAMQTTKPCHMPSCLHPTDPASVLFSQCLST